MKKLLLALALFLAPSLAWAQCNGVFPNGTVCGNATGSTNTPRATAATLFPSTVPGGLNGQIQYNNNGAFGGYPTSGNGTTVGTTSGVLGNGNCVKIDPSGNLVDAGAPCSTNTSTVTVFNPTQAPYNAVGDGTTDDTAAWQSFCAAVSAARSAWVYSPPGKTYRIFTNFTQPNQVLCRISGMNYLRWTMNGSAFLSHYITQVVFGGTGTTGDAINWTFSSWVSASGFPHTVSVAMGTGYTPAQMATAVAAQINSDSILTAANITATAVGNVVNINDTGSQVTWYTGNRNGTPGLTVTGAQTETVTVNAQYGVLISNSQNIIFDDFTATALSGYADSTRNSPAQMSWIYCTASGAAFPAYGCRNAQFNNLTISGCSNSVAIARVPHFSDWSKNISVNGSISTCGYGVSAQSDGQQSFWNLTTFNVGRAGIIYNVSGVTAQLYDTRTWFLDLNAVDMGAIGLVGDISNSTTSGNFIRYNYTDSGTPASQTTFLSITHTQGETGTANVPSHVDGNHFEFNVTVPTSATTGLISELSFIGTAGSQSPGEVSGSTELGNTISGTIYGAGAGASLGCIMSSTGSCSGYGSNLTRGSWSVRDLFVASDTRPLNIGGNLNNVQFSNFNGLAAPITRDVGSTVNCYIQAPSTRGGTAVTTDQAC